MHTLLCASAREVPLETKVVFINAILLVNIYGESYQPCGASSERDDK